MDWFRYHHGTPQDPKLTMLAKKVGVRRCEMTAVWDELMDYASRNVTRGHIGEIDLEVIAFTQEISIENVKAIYDILVEGGRIVNGTLKAWPVRNPKREDDTAAQRQREKRAKDKAKKEAEQITQDHDPSRNVTTEERRIEEMRLEQRDENNIISSTDIKSSHHSVPREEKKNFDVDFYLKDNDRKVENIHAPGWDKALLRRDFNNWIKKPEQRFPDNPVGAYLSWLKKTKKGRSPP